MALLWGVAEGLLFFVVPDVVISAVALAKGWRAGLVACLLAAAGASLGGGAMYLWSQASPEAALAAVGLAHAAALPVGYLSAGQRRRVALARLLVSQRPYWLLDEPMSALDAASQAMLTGLMRDHLGAGGAILAATHGPLGLDEAREFRIGP